MIRTLAVCLVTIAVALFTTGCATYAITGIGLKEGQSTRYDEVRLAQDGQMALHVAITYRTRFSGPRTNYCYFIGTPETVYLNTQRISENGKLLVGPSHCPRSPTWTLVPPTPRAQHVTPEILPEAFLNPARIYTTNEVVTYQYNGTTAALTQEYHLIYPLEKRSWWGYPFLLLTPVAIVVDIVMAPVLIPIVIYGIHNSSMS